MNVLITGAYGRCGTAIIEHLSDSTRYNFTYLDRSSPPVDHPYGSYETVVADISDDEAIHAATNGQDAVVHLAAYPRTGGDWGKVLESNIIGMYNVLEAVRQAEVETFVFASTNHVMGRYETQYNPEIYYPGHGLVIDYTDPVRPDSYYGATKVFGETLGRYYVENYTHPRRFYALRICSVRTHEYDHPYGDAERGVDSGEYERGSEEYEKAVARMKAMWHSRRDFAHQIDCCLRDEDVTFGVFSGVSDNRRRWFSIEHARAQIGYHPRDDGDNWNSPPK